MQNARGKKLADVKFRRLDRVKTLNKSIKINNDLVPINPLQLFNRILCTSKSPEALEHCFEFELASYPPSLFVDGFLRKSIKSNLLKEVDK